MNTQFRFLPGVLLLLAWLGWQDSSLARNIPEASFKTIEGETIHSKDLQGRPTLITFWATDCSSCMQEMPGLIELYNDYEARGAQILAVAMYYDPPNRVVTFSKGMQLPYPVVLDPQAKLARAFDVQLTPTHFIVAPDGTITDHVVGLMSNRDIRTRFDQLLAKSQTQAEQ